MVRDLAVMAMATGFFGSIIVTVHGVASVWRKRLELRERQPATSVIEERLARIENAVEVIALEVERIAEAQRFALRLGEQRDASRLPGRPPQLSEGRVVTPH